MDLPSSPYTFPQNFAVTDKRPDIVVWNASSVHMVELTIPFETGIEDAASRKQSKYAELVESADGVDSRPLSPLLKLVQEASSMSLASLNCIRS